MILRQLGNSPLSVSALGFGAGHIDTTGLDERDAQDLLDTALDLGVTFFDTARSYGASEERLGRDVLGKLPFVAPDRVTIRIRQQVNVVLDHPGDRIHTHEVLLSAG
ncbi:aryl-alcohol dehydrogenase-like predicted oxidoreductase [Arthrobacter sp. CAN_A212]|uniref:aldo/keto reductase n=1 Tax=unclassified Arthrobacter TaxID=235627 RepID=UPI0018CBE195|nr:aldo/keto reductase [Arthrobacter sp. CAN_C5]MBP2216701.1 aryl-alcohol dehydrogenase-like predicted oxidoreductase [Arthrobacter sp. CAN_C5]